MTPDCTISLAELAAAGVRLTASEAVAIARHVTILADRRELPGIPTASILRLCSDGSIAIEGPVAAGRSVERAARLLDEMLSAPGAPTQRRVPAALRLVIARARGSRDLSPYASLQEFAVALAQFAAADARVVVAALWETWASAFRTRAVVEPVYVWPASTNSGMELTISDVRRARRSTGLSLLEISDRSRIPISLLRELEWGYFVNWPGDIYGRAQLVRYARAAGLDEEVVIRAVWPLLEEAVRSRGIAGRVIDGAIVDGKSDDGASLMRIQSALPQVPDTRAARRHPAVAGAAIAALLAIAVIPAIWTKTDVAPVAPVQLTKAPPPAAPPKVAAPAAPAAPRPELAQPRSTQPTVRPAVLRTESGFSPAFASTGSAMFYHSDATGSSAIMRADTSSTGAVLKVTSILNDNALNFHARPSPDGQQIAFDSDRDGERGVYVADASGQDVRRISGEGFAAVPSWSPDGRRLTYVRAEPGRPHVWNLWVVDLDTTTSRRLTSHRVGQPWGASWFPDGDRIAYSREDRVIVQSISTGQQRVYPSPKKGRLLRTPAVSPDGRRLVFQLYRDGVWLLDLVNGSVVRILTDPTAEEFTWAPDGRQVAYHSKKTGEWGIWVMAAR